MAKYEIINIEDYTLFDDKDKPIQHKLIVFKNENQLLDTVSILAKDYKPELSDSLIDKALKELGR